MPAESAESRTRQLHIAAAVRLVWRSGPALVVVSALLVLLQGFLPVIPIYTVKLVVDGDSQNGSADDGDRSFIAHLNGTGFL